MQYRTLGRTGYKPSAIIYGGIVSAKHFAGAVMEGNGQEMSDHHVEWAIAHGINYFDVAGNRSAADSTAGDLPFFLPHFSRFLHQLLLFFYSPIRRIFVAVFSWKRTSCSTRSMVGL